MSKPFLLFFITLISLRSIAQTTINIPDSLRHYLDTVILLNKTKSVYRNSVDWSKIEPMVYAKANAATKVEDLFPAIHFLYDTLNDNHSYFSYKGQSIGKPYKKRDINPYLIKKIHGDHVGLQVKLLDNFYGYILIPSIDAESQEQANQYAQQIHDSLCSIATPNLKGWIVDLRFNQGGNMYAMLGGLGAIIGDGTVGFLTNLQGKTTSVWSIKGGDAYYNEKQMSNNKIHCQLSSTLPIAVLISEMTASSGEAIAIILKGRAKTTLLGKKTWGVSTSSVGYEINDYTSVKVTLSYMADRKGTIYKNGISPGKEIADGDNIEQLWLDEKVIEAIKLFKALDSTNKISNSNSE